MVDIVDLQLRIPQNKLDEWDSMVRVCGLKNRNELLNYAMTIMAEAVKEARSGRKLAFVNEEGRDMIIFNIQPLLELTERTRRPRPDLKLIE